MATVYLVWAKENVSPTAVKGSEWADLDLGG